jgi:outer membrane protein OmpA-like peptidoglycan-associated protein
MWLTRMANTRKSLNFWPAFTDMLFVLFVCVLVAAFGFRKSEQAAKAEVEDLKRKLQKQMRCGGAKTFLDDFRKCTNEALNKDVLKEDKCSVSIGEELIKFGPRRKTLSVGSEAYSNAQVLAKCIVQSEKKFAETERENFNKLKAIHIDGHTDCKGGDTANLWLGMHRAYALYELVSIAMVQEAPSDETLQQELLSRIAVRSFGEHKRANGGLCTDEEWSDADRRVTVSVELKLTGESLE